MAVVAAPFARYHDLYDRDGAGSGRRGRKNRFLIRPRRKKFNCDPLLWRYIRLDQAMVGGCYLVMWFLQYLLWELQHQNYFPNYFTFFVKIYCLWYFTLCPSSYIPSRKDQWGSWMMPVFVWTVSNSSYIIVSWRQVYNYKGCGEVGFGLVAGINPPKFWLPYPGGWGGDLGGTVGRWKPLGYHRPTLEHAPPKLTWAFLIFQTTLLHSWLQ